MRPWSGLTLIRGLGCALILLTLGGCLGGGAGGGIRDGAPATPVDPALIPDAIPRNDPVTQAGNKSPYTVLGKTYQVMSSAKGYRARGTASWYGSKFHGRKTSNGETYNLYGMTAAHKSLPIPCYVRVTNLANGRSAVVRVNDRGPFHDDRLIDLSYAAAVKLGFHQHGTAPVEIAVIDVDNGPQRTASALADAESTHYLQAGAFRDWRLAENLRERLQVNTQHPVAISRAGDAGGWYRVRIGPFTSRSQAEALRQQLAATGVAVAQIITDAQ